MLKKRIIPMLLLRKGRMAKGKRFTNFRDTGDPISAARIYNAQNADELVFIDIDANRGESDFTTLVNTIDKVSEECFMPLAVGGGVSDVDKIKQLLRAGADKVIITTAAVETPELINEASRLFGKQCIIVGIDVKKEDGKYVIYSHCGTKKTSVELIDFVKDMAERGAGEFLINSIDRDGTMEGYDLDLAAIVKEHTTRPIIIAGGSGTFKHLVDAFITCDIDGVGCASIFHFGDNNPIRARSFLLNAAIPMKLIK